MQSLALGNAEAVHPALRVAELSAVPSPIVPADDPAQVYGEENPPPAYERRNPARSDGDRPASRGSELSFEIGGSEKLPLPDFGDHPEMRPAPLRPRNSMQSQSSQPKTSPAPRQATFEME